MAAVKNLFRGNQAELTKQFNHITSNIARCDPLAEKVKGKDIVILLGNTKAGKSSLCHFIIGNPLVGVKGKRPRTFGIAAVDGYEGPAIGERVVAETTVPTVWFPARITEVLVDAPGFEDNRGEAQDIANCFYIKKMIVNAKSVKFMLISDVNDILSHNINNFITFVDKVYAMLPILEDVQRGVCLVFSKDNEHLSGSEMRDYIKDIYHEDGICIKKSILQSFIRDNSNIAFFRAPDRMGPIDENIGMDIIDATKRLTAIPCESLPVITPTVSDKSRVFLLFAEKQLSENGSFLTTLQAVAKDFEAKVKFEALHDRTVAEESKTKLLELRKTVRTAKASVEKDANLLNILDAVKQLSSPPLRERIERGDLKTVLQLFEFINDTLHRPGNTVFRMQFDMLIDRMEVALESSFAHVQDALQEITREEYEQRVRDLHDNLADRLKTYEEKIKELERTISDLRRADQESTGSCVIL